MLLITRPRCAATTSAQRDSKISTRSPIRSCLDLVGQRGEADDVGEADGDLGGVQVLLVRAEGLEPGHGRGEVAAPGVDQQPLEGRVHLLDHPHRRAGAAAGGARRPDSSSSTRCTSVATSQSASRAIVWPDGAGEVDGQVEVDERRSRRCPVSVETAPASAWVNATSRPCSGKPSARHSRRSSSIGDAGLLGHLERVEDRAPRRGSRARARRGRSCAVRLHRPSSAAVDPVGQLVQLLGDLQLDLLDARDVVQLDPALLAGVGDHERAAAEDPVDDADLEVDAADPVERDGAPLLGDQAGALDEPAVGERVGRGDPVDHRPDHPPEDHQTGHDPDARCGTMSAPSPSPSRLRNAATASATTRTSSGHQQHLRVRAGRDDDVLALVEQLLGDGHAPIMSPGRADVNDVARTHDRGPAARSRTTSRPAASTSTARPGHRLARRAGRPGRRGRRSRTGSTYVVREQLRSAVRAACQRVGPRRAPRGRRTSRSVRSTSCPAIDERRRRRDRQLVGGRGRR